ncbi:MAG: undecaprenyl-diphosphate phosphatase [Clostridia bacterium]|nr:undecaprenyl-diphosphate phosphatase [Clostridia bacterium]
MVQLGAILAVPAVYARSSPLFAFRDNGVRRTLSLWRPVLVGVIPAAVAGLLLDDALDRLLSDAARVRVVAVALIFYGLLFLLPRPRASVSDIREIGCGRALVIGCFQALSIVPGTSRSGSCLLGGRAAGVSDAVTAEFSFLVAIPVMVGVSTLKIAKFALRSAAGAPGYELDPRAVLLLLLGFLVSFLVSLPVIRELSGFVRRHGLFPFGVYRIALGAAVLIWGR